MIAESHFIQVVRRYPFASGMQKLKDHFHTDVQNNRSIKTYLSVQKQSLQFRKEEEREEKREGILDNMTIWDNMYIQLSKQWSEIVLNVLRRQKKRRAN